MEVYIRQARLSQQLEPPFHHFVNPVSFLAAAMIGDNRADEVVRADFAAPAAVSKLLDFHLVVRSALLVPLLLSTRA